MRTHDRYPLLRGGDHDEPYMGDDLDRVLRDIRAELRVANELAHNEGASREIRRALIQTRAGSRFATEDASDAVLDTLAAGGTLHARGPVRRAGAARQTQTLTGVMQKALAEVTPSAGGWLVPPEVSSEVLGLLRNRSAVMRMGVRVVPVKKQLAITSLSSGASASYVPENAVAPVSEQTFDQDVLLAPRDLVAMVPVSNRLLKDAADNPAVDQVVRADLAEVLALRADLAFLRGAGSGGEPVGIRNTSGLTAAPDLGANGATPSFDNLKDMVAALRAVNAPFGSPGWVFNGRLLNTLEKVKDSTGRYLADAGLLTFDSRGGSGTLLGYPYQTTGQIPTTLTKGSSSDTSEIYFSSDWAECWIGEEDALSIEASSEANYWDGTQWVSAWQSRQTVFRATTTHDIGLRRPELFSVMTGVRP